MLRSIGSVAVLSLSLFMVGCGGGGGGVVPTPTPPPAPANFTVGGTVTGLTGSGLVLLFHDSNLSGPHPISLLVGAGMFTFSPAVPQGGAYTVSVGTQPESPVQNCVVTNGTGVVGAANVANVTVACSDVAGYTVGGTVSGLVGSGLALAICRFHSHRVVGGFYDCGSSIQISVNGAFTLGPAFPAIYPDRPDRVEVTQQPSSPAQRCVVYNASGSNQTANGTGVMVACSGFSYVTNAADNTLSVYGVDAATGALAVVGTPIAMGISPFAIVGTEYGEDRYAFVGNEGSNDISAFAVNKITGALTAVPGSPFPASTDPEAMALDGSSYLYVANAGSDTVSAYSIDGDTGALTPLSPATYPTGKGPTSIAFDYIGGFVFVANHGGSNDISVFVNNGFNAGSLLPVAGSPFPAGGNPLSLALGAGGKFLYTANPDATNPSLSGFSIDPASGALSPLSGSPFPLPVSHYIATDQTGAFLYVTSGAGIVGYAIDASTGALTALPGFPVSAGANAYSVNIDQSNQFFYVANDGAGKISGFRLDASTGALTPIAGSPFPAGNHPGFLATF